MISLLHQWFPLAALILTAAGAPSSTFISSGFVPGVAPSIVSGTAAADEKLRAVASGYGIFGTVKRDLPCSAPVKSQDPVKSGRMASALLARKKGAAAAMKGGKIQVRILKFVQGTGKPGDVVMVTPAFFENKLKREGSAELVTDDEVEQEQKERAAKEQERLQTALDMQSKINGMTLEFPRKAGPTGHLFGGLSKKDVLLALKKRFPKGALDGKQVKIVSINGADGKDLGSQEIKEIGDFSASISLLTDIAANFQVLVKAEE